ncbi:endogenous retrovirus group K member 10 Gag polyprotein-like [Nycticebus coucang]|uniref:endogenous retrovirus group K member 10 Gag polyprotein-like n=1 Tax=Nycticebus coucang TaxID=9470 RepID=UPI00234C173C|nr:endogenous retrovirus group K member 10 Gag polyprotein-like [Nycticebus coucang]
MGQEVSQHELFVEQLRDALKTRGVKVKIKQLFQFFDFLKEVCPWFPQEGTIDEKRWKRVGDALNDFYQTFGPEKIPVTAFSYWNLITDIISCRGVCPVVVDVIKKGEELLLHHKEKDIKSQDLSQDLGTAGGTPPSCQLNEQEDLISLESDEEPNREKQKAPAVRPKVKLENKPKVKQPKVKVPEPNRRFYPDLKVFKIHPDDKLSDAEWNELEKETAKYYNPDWPTLGKRPPSYSAVPSAPPMAMATIDPKRDLENKIAHLQEQIKLEREHQELISELEKLKTGKLDHKEQRPREQEFTGPISQSPVRGVVMRRPPVNQERKEAFPVTETTDNQGQAWRHHSGFDFQVVKELKTAVTQYGATAPYTLAILESEAEKWLTPGD